MPEFMEDPIVGIEGAKFVYKPNFEGRIEGFNEDGSRFFNVRVPDNILEGLQAQGWNVKFTKPGKNHPNPDEHVPEPYLEVGVGFKYRPPKIYIIRDDQMTLLGESDAKLVDQLEFSNIDLSIRGRQWESAFIGQGSGVKAWLNEFYGTVQMDDLSRKYAHLMG